MEDYILSATAAKGMVRAFVSRTTEMVKEAKKIHSMSPVSAVALGRTMTAASLMSRTLKGEKDTITIQIKGDGPLGGIVVVTDSKSNVRGYVHNPQVYLPLNSIGKFDIAAAVGSNGYMNVIKDLGLKEPYIGYVKLISGEIAEDIAYYYANSEQIPTIVALGVLVDKDESILNAGGFIIQLLPGADEEIIDFLEGKIGDLPPITMLLSQGKTPEDILEIILGEKELKISNKNECRNLCNCSIERMEKNLVSLGKKEILDIIESQQQAELQCHFCNNKYKFSKEQLLQLIDEAENK